jgi:hypothetical protein
MNFNERLQLKDGESLVVTREVKKGHFGQKETTFYDILDSNNNKIGEVEFKESSETKGRCTTTYSVKKYDIEKKLILHKTWD